MITCGQFVPIEEGVLSTRPAILPVSYTVVYGVLSVCIIVDLHATQHCGV